MSSGYTAAPQTPGIAVNQMDPSADQGGPPAPTQQLPPQQPPTVTHPVLSSQAALAYAKTLDTDANRAVYHRQGPNGEPGFTIFNKHGGSSFVPVSSIARSNPGVVLADNMDHGHQVGGNQTQTENPPAQPPTQQPQQPQQPTTNAPGPNDQVLASSTDQGQSSGRYKVGDTVALSPTGAGPYYTITGESGFKYRAWDPLNHTTIELPQTQEQVDRENLYNTHKTNMTASQVQGLSNDQVQKLSQQLFNPMSDDQQKVATASYNVLQHAGTSLDGLYGLAQSNPTQYGLVTDALKWINEINSKGEVPNFDDWRAQRQPADKDAAKIAYDNANKLNGQLQQTADNIVAYANKMGRDPLKELNAAGFQTLGNLQTTGSRNGIQVNVQGTGGQMGGESSTQLNTQALSFDVNNLDRLKGYYQQIAEEYKRTLGNWTHSGVSLEDHVQGDMDALNGKNGRVIDTNPGSAPWVKWEIPKDQAQKPTESTGKVEPGGSLTNTQSQIQKQQQKFNQGKTADTAIGLDGMSLAQKKEAFNKAPNGTYFIMGGQKVRKQGDGSYLPVWE